MGCSRLASRSGGSLPAPGRHTFLAARGPPVQFLDPTGTAWGTRDSANCCATIWMVIGWPAAGSAGADQLSDVRFPLFAGVDTDPAPNRGWTIWHPTMETGTHFPGRREWRFRMA